MSKKIECSTCPYWHRRDKPNEVFGYCAKHLVQQEGRDNERRSIVELDCGISTEDFLCADHPQFFAKG